MDKHNATTIADGFLLLLQAEPTLMPPAPKDYTCVDMNQRLRETHPCLRCGRRARTTRVAQTELGNRWLDLCLRCNNWLISESTPASNTEGL